MAPRALPSLTILLAAPRGFCAGVERAIQIVELALDVSPRAHYDTNPFDADTDP